MLKILACYKWVIDQNDLRINRAAQELIIDRVGYKVGDYDKNAIEEAVILAEKYEGQASVITVGPPEARKSIKDVLSRGPDSVFFINSPTFNNLEPSQTSAILGAVLKEHIEYDLIICGESSGDLYAQQVGPRLAKNLGIPCITYANKISLEKDTLIVERKMGDGIEVVASNLPVLVTVFPEINSPRVPGLKDTLAAGKKPIKEITANEISVPYPSLLQTVLE